MNAAEYHFGSPLPEKPCNFIRANGHDGCHCDEHQIVVACEIQRPDDFVLDFDVPLVFRNKSGEGGEVQIGRTEQFPDRIPFLIFRMWNNETDLVMPHSCPPSSVEVNASIFRTLSRSLIRPLACIIRPYISCLAIPLGTRLVRCV